MNTDRILLRHTISGVTESYPAEYARDLLADPTLGQFLVEVESDKPEVLSQPYTVQDGERKPLDTKKKD